MAAGGYLGNVTYPAVTLEFAYNGLSRRVQKKTIKSFADTHFFRRNDRNLVGVFD